VGQPVEQRRFAGIWCSRSRARESQLESTPPDRERIAKLRRELERHPHARPASQARRRVPYRRGAVGYTNAGKSTLFQPADPRRGRRRGSAVRDLGPDDAAARPALGAEGDPVGHVGFISDLPTHLVAAFRATLEEVTEADIVVHVRERASPRQRGATRRCFGLY